MADNFSLMNINPASTLQSNYNNSMKQIFGNTPTDMYQLNTNTTKHEAKQSAELTPQRRLLSR